MKLLQILIALDQLVNTLIGGWADETISARAYRQAKTKKYWKVAMKVIDCLFFWEKDHCKNAYESERQRSQIAPEYRDN